jgi:hypothetical protein
MFLDKISKNYKDIDQLCYCIDRLFKLNKSYNKDNEYIDIINYCKKFNLKDIEKKIIKYILNGITIKRIRKMIKYISSYEKLEDICSKSIIKMIRFLFEEEQEQFYKNVCLVNKFVNKDVSDEIFSFI